MKCIYLRTNLVNGKQYVGQSTNFKQREYEWNCLNRSYAGSLINNARKKYGLDNWKVEILKECETQDELNNLEVYYIKKLNTKRPNGYNLTDGGEGVSGYHCSEEHKLKISLAKRGSNNPNWGKHLSEETRKKISESNKGKTSLLKGIPRTDEAKKKISEAKKGIRTSLGMTNHHHSVEAKKKMAKAHKGKPSNAAKKVYQYLNCVLVGVYSSVKEAINANNYHYSGALSSACRGNYNKEGNHTYNGYEWYYHQL